jgi:prevent-host-death family protein
MHKVGAFEAKTHFADLLERVQRGEQVLITRHGMPVAKLVPVQPDDRERRSEAIQRLKAFGKGRSLHGLSLRQLREDGRR